MASKLDPADTEHAVSDLGPLAWVLDELHKSLDAALKAVRRFVREAEQARGSELTDLDAAPLRLARQQLHQAAGALEMVGMPAPARLVLAMESLAQKLIQRPELCSDDAAACVEKAGYALTEYLGGVLKGMRASPVALFPQYRAVQELVDAQQRIHPADLWDADWRWQRVDLHWTGGSLKASDQARRHLDQAVLQLVKNADLRAAQRLQALCAALSTGQSADLQRGFWALASGFFDAIGRGLLPLDAFVKRTASRVLQQYAALTRGENTPSERVAQDMVFFCAQAGADAADGALQAVRQAYGLAKVPAADYETVQFGRFDPALLALARKRIATAAETWSALAGGDVNRMKLVGEQFGAVVESVLKLHPENTVLARALSGIIDSTVRSGLAPTTAVAMEVATSILYLEAAYDDLDPTHSHMAERADTLAQRLQAVRSGGEPEPLEGWMEDLYRRVSDRQTMGSVVDELRASLGEVEKSLDQYFRNPQEKGALREVPSRLSQMRGVFSVLGLDQPALATLRMRSLVDRLLIDDPELTPSSVFEKLGNSLGALGLLIDMLSYQRAMAKKLFVYDEQENEFRPLMGRERVSGPMPLLAESTPEPAPDMLPEFAAFAPAAVPAAVQPAAAAEAQAMQDAAGSNALPAAHASADAAAPQAEEGAEDEDEDEDIQAIFVEEAHEVIQSGIRAARALAIEPADLAEQTVLRRAFHTLKGSSRMVGLNEFGEAAWAMEQLLNAWLAEQKPASDELITLCSSAMLAFGRWIAALPQDQAAHWSATPFRHSADAMRLHGQVLALATPGLVDGDGEGEGDFDAAATQVLQLAPTPEVEAHAPASAEASAPTADFAATALANSLDLDRLPEPARPGSASVGRSDFADTSLAGTETTQAFQAAGTQAPQADAHALTSAPDAGLEFDVGELDFSAPATPAAAHAAVATATASEPAWAQQTQAIADRAAPVPHDSSAPETWQLEYPAQDELAELDRIEAESLHGTLVAHPLALDFGAQAAVSEQDLETMQPDFGPPTQHAPYVFEEAAPQANGLDAEQVTQHLGLDAIAPTEYAPMAPTEYAPMAPTEYAPMAQDEASAHDAPQEAPQSLEAVDNEASDEPVKVIGDLRLSIPFYNVYLNEADEWSRRLQTELSEWAMELHRPVPDACITLAHSLLGSSATVGFNALSGVARALEHALEHVQLMGPDRSNAWHAAVFNNAAEEIRWLLHQFAAGFLKESDPEVLLALQRVVESAPAGADPADKLAQADAPASAEAQQDFRDTNVAQAWDLTTAQPLSAGPEEPAYAEPPQPEPRIAEPMVEEAGVAVALPVPRAAPLRVVEQTQQDIEAQDSLDPDLFGIFQEEAVELMPQLGNALRAWVSAPDTRTARSEALRVLHTLKGSARLAGAMRLGELAHRMESAIEEIGAEGLQSVQLEPLLAHFDGLQFTLDALGQRADDVAAAQAAQVAAAMPDAQRVPTPASPVPASVPEPPAPSVAPALAPSTPLRPSAMPMAASAALPTRTLATQSVRVRSQLLDRLVNQAGEVMISRSRMDAHMGQLRASLGELNGNLERLRQQLRDVELQAESQMQSRMMQTRDVAQGFDPLEFDRFTRVQELTRMMAESVNDVATVQRNLLRAVDGAEDDLVAQGRQTRELQRDLLRTRMVEFEGVSERLYAVVRQAAKESGKLVKLDIVGGSIEMDRGVLDRMTPAFEHILRNAVAHGIESAAERAAAGKPAMGSITVQVSQESNDVSVVCSDDGAGLRMDRIRARAIDAQLLAPDAELDEPKAIALLFTPGFSTAEQVTELSGRGIGMDVVLTEVNALGGRIELATQAGQGSSFKLVLPLTTAVTQVVMLRMGNFTIGVPSNLMETVLRAPQAAVEQAYATGVYDLAGAHISFFWAGALLQVSAGSQEPATRYLPVAVFRSAGQRLALHVDEVLGNREVVVKNLGPQLARLPGLAGMSVLASGAVVLIYNPVALATVYGDNARKLQAAQSVGAPASNAPTLGQGTVVNDELPLVLVVDDSITVRRVTQRLLKREGFRVALANDGLQALEKLQEEKPAVMLSDIEMPRMDGFDLVRTLRADAQLRDLPVIMITSRIAQKHRDHAIELGVDHYLGKPYSEEELLALVRSYCKQTEAV